MLQTSGIRITVASKSNIIAGFTGRVAFALIHAHSLTSCFQSTDNTICCKWCLLFICSSFYSICHIISWNRDSSRRVAPDTKFTSTVLCLVRFRQQNHSGCLGDCLRLLDPFVLTHSASVYLWLTKVTAKKTLYPEYNMWIADNPVAIRFPTKPICCC